MTLRDLMGTGAPEAEVTGLAYSSDAVRPGSLFFCVRGFTADGHEFAPEAVRRGVEASERLAVRLLRWEALEALPTRQITGHFVVVRARRL